MAARADELFAELFNELRDQLRDRGISVRVTDGYRSFATQAAVLRRRGQFGKGGFAAPVGKSFHNYGFAVDVAISPQDWATFGRVAEGIGFRWGGRFTKREPWHIDLGSIVNINEARELFDRAFLVGVS